MPSTPFSHNRNTRSVTFSKSLFYSSFNGLRDSIFCITFTTAERSMLHMWALTSSLLLKACSLSLEIASISADAFSSSDSCTNTLAL